MSVTDNSRRLGDALLTSNAAALPNAANTTTTTAIDLGVQPYAGVEGVNIVVTTTEGTGANNKNVNITIHDSNESNANFAAAVGLGQLLVTEVTAKYAAATRTYKLQPGVKRYIRLSATGEANGGNAADGSMTMAVRR